MSVNIGEIVLEIEALLDADRTQVSESETSESEQIRVVTPAERVRART